MREVRTQLNIANVTPASAEAQMANVAKQVVVYGNEAKRVSFLGRLDSDLDLVRKRCDMYLGIEGDSDDDVDLLALAADGAFIAYGRLDNGAGGRFPEELKNALTTQLQGEHKWALAMRDKFVGHAVNGLHRTIPLAGVTDDHVVHYVFSITARVVPTVEDIQQLRALSIEVQQRLAPLLSSAREELFRVTSSGASVLDNRQPQFVLVARTEFDYLSAAGELTGTFGIPAAL